MSSSVAQERADIRTLAYYVELLLHVDVTFAQMERCPECKDLHHWEASCTEPAIPEDA